jgi:hypothetical protein
MKAVVVHGVNEVGVDRKGSLRNAILDQTLSCLMGIEPPYVM